jgi:hypothetical protein
MQDPTGELKAAVHRSVLEAEPSFGPGATVSLREVCELRIYVRGFARCFGCMSMWVYVYVGAVRLLQAINPLYSLQSFVSLCKLELKICCLSMQVSLLCPWPGMEYLCVTHNNIVQVSDFPPKAALLVQSLRMQSVQSFVLISQICCQGSEAWNYKYDLLPFSIYSRIADGLQNILIFEQISTLLTERSLQSSVSQA